MSVVRHEIKKMWNIKILAIIAALCTMYFFGAGMNGNLHSIIHVGTSGEILAEINARYGAYLTGAELDEFIIERHAQLEAGDLDDAAIVTLNELSWLYNSWHDTPARMEHYLSQELFEWQRQLYADAIASDDIFALIADMREHLVAEANVNIEQAPIFAANGIRDYDDFTAAMAEFPPITEFEESLTRGHLARALQGQSSNFAGEKLDLLRFMEFITQYYGDGINARLQRDLERLDNVQLTGRQRQRMAEVSDAGEHRGTMPGNIFWGMTYYFHHFALMLILASILLHSPLVTTDRMRSIQPLQYSSKLGRGIMLRQFAATLLSAILLATLMTAALGLLLARAGVLAYWNHGLTSFPPSLSLAITFSPMTLGSYMLIMAAIGYALCLGTGALAFIVSRLSRNLITLAIKAIPVFVALSLLHGLVLPSLAGSTSMQFFTAPLTLWNNLYLATGFAYLDMIIIAVFAAVAILSAWYIARREKRLEAG